MCYPDRIASNTIGDIIAQAGWSRNAQLHLAERFIHQAGLLPAYAKYLREELDQDERAGHVPGLTERVIPPIQGE